MKKVFIAFVFAACKKFIGDGRVAQRKANHWG
jgi:hypothetical protein